VYVIEHVYGGAELRDPKLETPSRYPVVRYAGQPIAGVAAVSQQIANDAAKLVTVQYDTMPFVVDRSDARSDTAPVVFPGTADAAGSAGGGGGPKNVPQTGNVHGPQRKTIGDTKKGLADSDVIVEGEYFTQVQTHSALETHGFVVDWKPDEITIYASTQGTSSVRDEFAEVKTTQKQSPRHNRVHGWRLRCEVRRRQRGRRRGQPVAKGKRSRQTDARSPPGAHRLQSP
jgi:xanthine dehydrogenase YagR molybdenum-binding subunit